MTACMSSGSNRLTGRPAAPATGGRGRRGAWLHRWRVRTRGAALRDDVSAERLAGERECFEQFSLGGDGPCEQAFYPRLSGQGTWDVHRAGIGRDLSREGESMTDRFPAPLVVHERRWSSSLLAPVYLQLLEGLRRVTEGQRGAGLCRECGQPFLTLDARRSSFCTDRERFRFSQRERRKRLSSTA